MAASQSLANYHRTTASNLKVFTWSLLTFPPRTKKQFHCVAEERRYGGDKKNVASASLFPRLRCRNLPYSLPSIVNTRERTRCFSTATSLSDTESNNQTSTESSATVLTFQNAIQRLQVSIVSLHCFLSFNLKEGNNLLKCLRCQYGVSFEINAEVTPEVVVSSMNEMKP